MFSEFIFNNTKLLILIVTPDNPLVCDTNLIFAITHSGFNYFTRFFGSPFSQFYAVFFCRRTPFATVFSFLRRVRSCVRTTTTVQSYEPTQHRTTRMHNHQTIMSSDGVGGGGNAGREGRVSVINDDFAPAVCTYDKSHFKHRPFLHTPRPSFLLCPAKLFSDNVTP